MTKVIAAINMTLDGVLDHTKGIPDAEVHQHYEELIQNSGVILYGSITYQLMRFWQSLVESPSGEKSMDDFALAIHQIPKLVFSSTLQETHWSTAQMASLPLVDTIKQLQQESTKDILIGSRSLILQALKENLIDELQICIHPVIAGEGMLLFENPQERKLLELVNTKTFKGGAVVLYYKPVK